MAAPYTGYRLNPIETVALRLYTSGAWKYPEPSREIVAALWKLDRLVPMMMGGCPKSEHDAQGHEEIMFAGGLPCRLEAPRKWYIFKMVPRMSVLYPVLVYTIADDASNFRHLTMDDVRWIARLMRTVPRDQIDAVIHRKVELRRKARQARRELIQEMIDPHLSGMRAEAQQFNLSSVPTDDLTKTGGQRTITNLYRNERTASE